jgi:hypothetical protein
MAYSFDSSFGRESLRRQFRLSIGLIVAMAVATFVLGFSLPVEHARHTAQLDLGSDMMGRFVPMNE